jgi:hypothetical protein
MLLLLVAHHWWAISPRAACQRCPPTPTGRPHCTCRQYSGPRTRCCQSSAGTSPTCPSKNSRRRERRSCLSRRAPAGVRAVAAVVAVPGGARIVGCDLCPEERLCPASGQGRARPTLRSSPEGLPPPRQDRRPIMYVGRRSFLSCFLKSPVSDEARSRVSLKVFCEGVLHKLQDAVRYAAV